MQKDESFASALDAVAQRYQERAALVLDDGTWSYATLSEWSGRMAAVLRSGGVGPGDRVLVQVDKSAHAVALYLGCLRVGAAFVPLNTAYTTEEIRYFLRDADPALVVCRPADLEERVRMAGSVPVLSLGGDASGSLLDAARSAVPDFVIEPRAAGDLAAIVYTSGTTGRSKGAMLSHANLESGARVLIAAWGWRDDDVLLHALPIFHVHGLFVALHCALLTGTPMIFMPAFDARAVLEALPRATVLMGVPTFYTRLLADPAFTSGLTGNIRVFISGSAPLLSETFSAFEDRIGQRILERYGMTETSVIASNPLHGERRASAVGPTVAGMQLRLVDDAGMPVADGEVGHVQVRGESVFRGYWRMPEKTREDISPEGFFNTGDDGRVDAEGYLYLVGRSKDLIITGGLNVYPSEVEAVLDRLPQVLESAVIALPHPDFGEQVAAVIVPRVAGEFDEAQARAAVKTELAGYKLPKSYLLVDALRRNTMGKVQKNLLRQQFQNGA